MKVLIAILIICALSFVGIKLYEQWEITKENEKAEFNKSTPQILDYQLPGMESSLEGALEVAKKKGASGLRDFLTRYGKTIKDPRLAAIELDYVVLVARDNIVEARKAFARVKQRTSPSSPIYPRIKQLEKTYE